MKIIKFSLLFLYLCVSILLMGDMYTANSDSDDCTYGSPAGVDWGTV